MEETHTERFGEIGHVETNLESVLPLLDLMAANHAARLGMEIPPALKQAMDHRHRELARRHPNPARISDEARRTLLAGMPRPSAEALAQHKAEWLARAEDVISRYA